ncbi:hypothetical protein K488DRAFT_46551 [Vararia minispora EC-137]|uniref:Uncharacterized protein n=1 Tax=Vararia minispora EC-137 TaxID=1314806 RepID=A0ACB8QR43_9AGAM|nr:hypothetical protein K488DRAFT_46551 [Vararia minispora EC-137]
MPLRTHSDSQTLSAISDVDAQYVIFYASRGEDGEMWCPDCREVEALVKGALQTDTGPSGLIVYVGNRLDWKSPTNPFRGEPWNIRAIPTIIHLKEIGRLVEGEIGGQLDRFVQS